ncbi:MAG TPA: DNA gyrase subunit A [Methanomassiliicoccales archaeon]|nr:DNA gyrase subunit A [Methanomassiliicoccales archaeon]
MDGSQDSNSNPPEGFQHKVVNRPVEQEMKKAYIDYAMSVIVSRALPDVRDGLKPVHRRILYSMYDMGLTSGKKYMKSARVVGDAMGRYHPHGDLAVYDSLVRMAQEFSLRYPLVDGQGNFGSVDGDEAAAMRYTECRMEKITEEMLADLEKETVEFVPNFDGSLQEPSVLPAKLPNLLVNGSSGIAVGMATNMPPHNLAEIVDGLVALIDKPDLEAIDLMDFVKGPDFPTGGIIYGISGILEAYSTGRGRLKVRARTSIEEKEGKKRIIVSEIPYQVNKASLIENIAELVKDKKIDGITDLRDESDREGMRIVIELRRDVMEDIVRNQLFQHTQMEATFGVINLALVNNEPKILTLREIMQAYLDFRREVVIRRTKFELKEARKREHILIALMKAIDALDETIKIIRESETPEIARNALMARFELDEEQAKAILDMRLQKLTGLELESLRQEFADLEKVIADLEAILASEERVTAIVKGELLKLKTDYGDDRRTEIVHDAVDLDIEDLIPVEDMVLMVTQDGYIKRLPLDTYKEQRRGGVGLMGMETKEEDHVTDLFVSSTHDNVMFFTNFGKMFLLKTWKIPVGGRHSKGKPIVNLLPRLEEGEKVIDKLPIKEFDSSHFLVFATKRGRIKKTPLDAYKNVRINGIIAVGMNEGDELIDTKIADDSSDIILATRNGRVNRFQLKYERDESGKKTKGVRPMGRPAAGVMGIRLYQGDEVVSMAVVTQDSKLLTVTEKGYGKVSLVGKYEAPEEAEEVPESESEAEEPEGQEPEEEEVRDEYRKTNRGGRGVKSMRIGEKTGKVVAVLEVSDEDGILIASDSGNVIRTSVSEFRVLSRVTQGVRAKRLEEGETVIAVARLVGEHEKQAVEEAESHVDENGLPIEEQPDEREEEERDKEDE